MRHNLLTLALVLTGCNSNRPTVSETSPTNARTHSASPQVAEPTTAQQVTEKSDELGQAWTIQGEVVDKDGKLVDEFDAATIWSSNGVYWDAEGKIPEGEFDNVWKREGELAVSPRFMAIKTSAGRFSLAIQDRPRATVLVANAARTHGALALVDRKSADRHVRMELLPLVRVTAELFCSEAGKAPDQAMTHIYVAGSDNIHVTQCLTRQGKVSFLLPPGTYEIYANGDSPVAAMSAPEKPVGIPLHGVYQRGMRFTIEPHSATIDLGVLELKLPKDSRGNSVDIAKFYGQRPPALNVTDVLGGSKDLKLEDYRGKWVLIEFWALWCSPCIAWGLPELNAFQEEHMGQRNQFQILTICDSRTEEAHSFAEMEPKFSELKQKIWGDSPLPFPVALDNGSETASAYAVPLRPHAFLIDPEGNLVDTSKEEALRLLARMLAK